MVKTKSLLCAGFLLGGVLASGESWHKPTTQLHYNDKELSELLEIIEDDNPLCAKWGDDSCLQCAPRAFFNQKGICVEIDPLCQHFDYSSRKCTNCYPGYELVNTRCSISVAKPEQDWSLTNPLCAAWQNKKCLRCSPKTYFNSEKLCIMVSPDCKTYSDANGFCLSCYEGYELDGRGKCLKVDKDWKNKDPFCSRWDLKGNCLQCASKSFRNKQGLCQQVDPNCNTHSNETGQCQSCFKGYGLKNGKCVQQVSSIASTNPYCAKWDNNKCLKCAARTYLNIKSGLCAVTNPLCRTFNETNGDCTSCYPGFKLSEGKCQEFKQNYAQTNPLCSQWAQQKCLKCSNRSYFNQEGICTMVDANCATYSQKSGLCLTCYPGYEVSNGKCLVKDVGPSALSLSQNPLCSEWKGQTCIRCATRSYLEDNGICTQVDPYCQNFAEDKRICTKCYRGYKLKKNLKGCALPGSQQTLPPPQQYPSGYEDLNCAEWINPQICKTCSPGSYKNEQGKCILYDSNCKVFNSEFRFCQQCSSDLVPLEDKCLKMQIPPALDSEKCVKWREGTCLECGKGLSLNQTGACACKP